MDRNRDFRRATISTVNGLPRRRPRINSLRDSTDEDRQMELQETVRLRDREQLEKKDRDREFPKRRRVDRSGVLQKNGSGGESHRENESTDSSDEEYYAEEHETRIHQRNRMNQLWPTSSSLSNNRRGLRTLRSSPVVRAAVDEMLGVPIPRRTRSASAKRLQKYWNLGSGGFVDDVSRRRFSSPPATVGPIGSASDSPSSSGASMKKKMKSVEPRTRVTSSASNSKSSSVIQDDIEIEVAEALFDLMKQSQSQSQKQDKVDIESVNTADGELKRLKAACVKDGNNGFLVQNEHSIKVDAETTLADSMKVLKKEQRIEKDKFPDDPAQELVNGDGFVNKGDVGSPKENESPSCVKVNACYIQDPTVTKADYAAIAVEAKKEAKLEIDLMAPPPLLSLLERNSVVVIATDPKVMTQDVQKKDETISKDGPLAVETRMSEENNRISSDNESPNLDLEKRRLDISSVSDSTTQQQQNRNEQRSQYPPSLFPFPIGMSSWPGVLPRPGYVPPLQAVLPIDGSARSLITMQPPQFKLSEPRQRRCTTHQYISQNIQHHQQLIKKSLSSGPTGPATLYGTKPLNLKSMLPRQKFIPGNTMIGDFQEGENLATISDGSRKDKSSDAATAFNATSGKPVLQQASGYSANNFLHGPGLIFPIGHHQTTMMAPANSSGPASAVGNASLPTISAGRLSVNFPLPGVLGAVSFNQPTFPSTEAAPYMATLQNNSSSVHISTSIDLPPFKGGSPTVPFFNSSLYSSSVFNATQNQQPLLLSLPHVPVQSASQNMSTFSGLASHKHPPDQQQTGKKFSDNKFPSPVSGRSFQPDKLHPIHSSSKSDREISRSGTSVADGFLSHSLNGNNVQPCSFPVQPMNFTMIPPVAIGGAGAGAVGNKHGDPQQGSKGGIELIPQPFALSFSSNASTTAGLNFSSMMQNSAIFQMLPDMSWNGNQMLQTKNFQVSEGMTATHGGQSFNFSKSDCNDISSLSTMRTSNFDGLARTSGMPVTIPNLEQHQHQHQHQRIQAKKHHMHQMQLAGAAQVQASAPNSSIPTPTLSSIFPNNPIFTQIPVQSNNSSVPSKWENFPQTAAPEVSSQSTTSTLVSIPPLKNSQGTHITFSNSQVLAASFQGPQPMFGSLSSSSISKNTGSSQRSVSTVSKTGSTISALASQETEASPNGPGQKLSPACRRNVTSILSTCPSQLSELKY